MSWQATLQGAASIDSKSLVILRVIAIRNFVTIASNTVTPSKSVRPEKKLVQAFHAAPSVAQSSAPTASTTTVLTAQDVQQMVLSALSALGLQGKSNVVAHLQMLLLNLDLLILELLII